MRRNRGLMIDVLSTNFAAVGLGGMNEDIRLVFRHKHSLVFSVYFDECGTCSGLEMDLCARLSAVLRSSATETA